MIANQTTGNKQALKRTSSPKNAKLPMLVSRPLRSKSDKASSRRTRRSVRRRLLWQRPKIKRPNLLHDVPRLKLLVSVKKSFSDNSRLWMVTTHRTTMTALSKLLLKHRLPRLLARSWSQHPLLLLRHHHHPLPLSPAHLPNLRRAAIRSTG